MKHKHRSRKHRSRRRNMGGEHTWKWIAIGAGVLAVGAAGYAIYSRRSKKSEGYKDLPPPPDQSVGPDATPQPTGPAEAIDCELGPNYPGFTRDDITGICSPGDSTPAGIYIDRSCTDFVFVNGDDGDQPKHLESLMAAAVTSSQGQGQSSDPIEIVTAFLMKWWPQCDWPPKGNESQRIIQMFQALVYLVGRTVVHDGGHTLGATTIKSANSRIAQRLAELGLPPFEPGVVSDIEVPTWSEGVAQPPGLGYSP